MKEIFKEAKNIFSLKMEAGRVEEAVFGSHSGWGQRTIAKNKIDYSFGPGAKKEILEEMLGREKEIIEVIKKIYFSARNCRPDIQQVKIIFQKENQLVLIERPGGEISDKRNRYFLAVEVVAAKKGKLQKARETLAGIGEFILKEPAAFGRIPAERVAMMLEAQEAPAGQMPVVIAGEAGGTMIHEACGHGLEADFIFKKISVYSGQLGQKVASQKITVIDDPTLAGLYGSYRFDDEGTASAPTVLIEKGILKNYLTDIYYGQLLKLKSNGHGRRQSFQSQPVPRMANTYVASGQDDPKEMVAGLKKGLWVKKLGGGQVEVVSGDFVFEVEEGYLIENGQIKSPVRRAILIGNGPQVLRTVDAVGADLKFQPGHCGKDDLAAVTSGQPTLRIPMLTVGGMSLN